MAHESEHTISIDEARHVADLARLQMTEEQIESCRGDLESILGHIETINAINVEGIEPLAAAIEMTNRLSPDEVHESLPVDEVLANAPALEDRYIAVPKVLDEDGNN